MKPGRNAPCPCGSGKKYKKCCYLKESTAVDDRPEAPDDQEDDRELADLLFRGIVNMRRYSLNKKTHIKEYDKARKLHGEIIAAMIQYQEDGKFHQQAVTDHISQDRQENEFYLLESEFDLESRVGAQGFYDMLIYKPAPNMNCITEEFIQKHRYRKPEKVEFLHSMLDSRLGLFEILRTDSDEGCAYLREVFTGAEYKIIDVGLSGNKNHGDFYLYTRIIQYHDICFGSGLNLVFAKTDGFIQDHIRKYKMDYTPEGEFIRFTQLYNRYSTYPDKIRVLPNM